MFHEILFAYINGYAEAWDKHADSPYKIGKDELMGVAVSYIMTGNAPDLAKESFCETFIIIRDNVELLIESRG